MSDESQPLNEIIERYVKSEESLRQISQSIEGLEAARQELSLAREDLASSDVKGRQSLDDLRKQLASAAQSTDTNLSEMTSAVFALTTEMRGIARDMKDTATAFRSYGPDRLEASFTELTNRIRARERLFVIWMSLLTVIVIALGVLAVMA